MTKSEQLNREKVGKRRPNLLKKRNESAWMTDSKVYIVISMFAFGQVLSLLERLPFYAFEYIGSLYKGWLYCHFEVVNIGLCAVSSRFPAEILREH